MNNAAHTELAKVLNSVEGLAAISNYECELMDRLYPAKKWTKIYAPEKTIHSTKDVRQEVLWVNYDLKKLGTLKTASLFENE
jgi:DNA adenine methylase